MINALVKTLLFILISIDIVTGSIVNEYGIQWSSIIHSSIHILS